jgi:hypothetical protein
MDIAIPVIDVKPEHTNTIEIVVHLAEIQEEQHRLNFFAALENDDRITAVISAKAMESLANHI